MATPATNNPNVPSPPARSLHGRERLGANLEFHAATLRLPGRSDLAARAPWLSGLGVLVLVGAGLAVTNPTPADFQAFAADRLVDEISDALCVKGGLPVLMRMVIPNCQELVEGQREALAGVVARHTRRTDLIVASLYRSEVGGQSVLAWRVPRFRSTVLAVAGQFVLIAASSDPSEEAP